MTYLSVGRSSDMAVQYKCTGNYVKALLNVQQDPSIGFLSFQWAGVVNEATHAPLLIWNRIDLSSGQVAMTFFCRTRSVQSVSRTNHVAELSAPV